MSSIIEVKRHPLEYLVLLLILLFSAIVFVFFSYDHYLQRRVVYMASTAYFTWSLYHHYRRGDLHTSIIIEYLLFILLAIVITGATLF
jgi:hypothetical protein